MCQPGYQFSTPSTRRESCVASQPRPNCTEIPRGALIQSKRYPELGMRTYEQKAAPRNSPFYHADACWLNPDYGATVIPKWRWKQAQRAEGAWAQSDAILRRRIANDSKMATGDRAMDHVQNFDFYRALPEQLGRVAELGAGPWTQTLYALLARPKCNVTSLTVVDPGVKHYIKSGSSSYVHGHLQGLGPHRWVSVTTLAMGAEQLPLTQNEAYDAVVMINTVEHTFNAFATLHSAHRLLKKGGLFIFHERAVRFDYGANVLHPVRLKSDFFLHHLKQLYESVYLRHGATAQMRKKPFMVEKDIYFIGRRR